MTYWKPQVKYIHVVIADSLIDYLTHVAFYVSGWHEQAGTVTQYFLPLTADGERAPTRGMGLGKVWSGKQEKDVQVKRYEVSLHLPSTRLTCNMYFIRYFLSSLHSMLFI